MDKTRKVHGFILPLVQMCIRDRDIQPRGLFLAIALHHAVKLPAVTLIKRGVVSSKVKVRAASMPLAANVTPHSGAGQRAAYGI